MNTVNFSEFERNLERLPSTGKKNPKRDDLTTSKALAYIADQRGYCKESIARALGTSKGQVGQYISQVKTAMKLVNEVTRHTT